MGDIASTLFLLDLIAYGTEMTISKNVRESKAAISRILDEVEPFGTVHRDL